ncbi:MAG: TerB family tellurite resistance protein [bacterium]
MIDWIKRVLGAEQEDESSVPEEAQQHDVRIAACALFLEMANIDGEFSDTERKNVCTMLKQEHDLSEQQVAELAEAAEKELKEAIDLWHFTNLINKNYSEEEKIRVVELLWKLIYADGKLDQHEDYLIRKLAKLLGLTHKQLIEAKLKVLKQRP